MRSLRSDTLTMRVTGVKITVFSSAIVFDVIVHCHTAGCLLSQTLGFDPFRPVHNHKERQSHEATHCPFRAWCEVCVKAKSPDGKHTKQLGNEEHIPVLEFDYAFATDTPGDPNRKISMMVATDSIHGSIFAVSNICWQCKDFGIDISVAFMHARTDEKIYVKVPSGIKSSKCWKLKAAVNGTRKASKHWQEYSSDRLVTNMLFQQNDINPCIYKRFCDDLDLEQHGDDFLGCGVTRSFGKIDRGIQ